MSDAKAQAPARGAVATLRAKFNSHVLGHIWDEKNELVKSFRQIAQQAIEMLERASPAAPAVAPLPDHDNHHNALKCPYCNPNGRLVDMDELRCPRCKSNKTCNHCERCGENW